MMRDGSCAHGRDRLGASLMPRDIRELHDDPVAYAAELRQRWGGL